MENKMEAEIARYIRHMVYEKSRWVKFLLLFCRTHVITEPPHKPDDLIFYDAYQTDLYYKKLFGRIYVVKTERYIPPPEHFNCRCIADELEGEGIE